MSLWWAVVVHAMVVAAAMIAGIYAVAVLDAILGRAVAGRPLRVTEALAAPVSSAALLLITQRTTTERPDAAVWALAPALLGGSAGAALAVIPFSSVPLGASTGIAPLAGGDVAPGIVAFGAAMALVMVAVYLHGWSANSIFPLVGAYRFVAEALSYEMPLALVLIAAALPAESLSVADIVRAQAGAWNVVRQPLGLPLYLIAGLGLAFWGPLALPDGADLAGGTSAELSGVALLLWRAARSAVLVAVAAMGAAAFLGGWLGPGLPGVAWMTLKTLALLVVLLVAGHTLARVRLEWFVRVAWAILIPVALIDIFASGVLVLWTRGR